MAIIMATVMGQARVIAIAMDQVRATLALGATISMDTLATGTERAMATAMDQVIATAMAMAIAIVAGAK